MRSFLAIWVLINAAILWSCCAPPMSQACAGSEPITCECVQSCVTQPDGGLEWVLLPFEEQVSLGCRVCCWDRSTGGRCH